MVRESVDYLENKFGAGTVLRSYVDSIYIKKTPLISTSAIVDELNDRLCGMGVFVLEKQFQKLMCPIQWKSSCYFMAITHTGAS